MPFVVLATSNTHLARVYSRTIRESGASVLHIEREPDIAYAQNYDVSCVLCDLDTECGRAAFSTYASSPVRLVSVSSRAVPPPMSRSHTHHLTYAVTPAEIASSILNSAHISTTT